MMPLQSQQQAGSNAIIDAIFPALTGRTDRMKNSAARNDALIKRDIVSMCHFSLGGLGAAANHLRNYELILPVVAVDAGMGELSRMVYLLTMEFGPRLRLSAVTTDMLLVADKPVDLGIQSFCVLCKKCAVCCPSQ